MKKGLRKLIAKAEDNLCRLEDRISDLVSDEAIERAEDKLVGMEEVLGLLEEALSVLEDE